MFDVSCFLLISDVFNNNIATESSRTATNQSDFAKRTFAQVSGFLSYAGLLFLSLLSFSFKIFFLFLLLNFFFFPMKTAFENCFERLDQSAFLMFYSCIYFPETIFVFCPKFEKIFSICLF